MIKYHHATTTRQKKRESLRFDSSHLAHIFFFGRSAQKLISKHIVGISNCGLGNSTVLDRLRDILQQNGNTTPDILDR
jgi:hypothetical protein